MKMKIYTLITCFCCLSFNLMAQEGIVSGTLTANNGEPLIGAVIVIEGAETGATADVEGNYSIKCKVGDVLIVSYVGYENRRIKVTAAMFGNKKTNNFVQYPVQPIISDAYKEAVKSALEDEHSAVPDIEEDGITYTFEDNGFRYRLDDISKINIKDKEIQVKRSLNLIKYQLDFSHESEWSTIAEEHLPERQNQYAQGIPLNGTATWQGAETNTIFSFGPALSSLEYDGSNYAFNPKGQLVPSGMGNGEVAQAYHNPLLQTAYTTKNTLGIKIKSGKTTAGLSFLNKQEQNIFGDFANQSNGIHAKFSFKRKYGQAWKLNANYSNSKEQFPNVHGVYNKMWQSHLLTPPSFNNAIGYTLTNGTNRSFAPNQYNHTDWWKNQTENEFRSHNFGVNANSDFYFGDFQISINAFFQQNRQFQDFNLPNGTLGFENGWSSYRKLIDTRTGGEAYFSWSEEMYIWDWDIPFHWLTRLKSTYQDLNYFLAIQEDDTHFDKNQAYNAANNRNVETHFDNSLQLGRHFSNWGNITFRGILSNFSFFKKWAFQPSVAYDIFLDKWYSKKHISRHSLNISYSRTNNTAPLLYSGTSHNNLHLLPSEAQSFFIKDELLANENLNLEQHHIFEVGTILRMKNWLTASLAFENKKSKNIIFPVFDNGSYILENLADISEQNLTASLQFYFKSKGGLKYRPEITWSKNWNKVDALNNNQNNIPIAGFQSTQQQLIVGEAVGTIVGSSYEKNAQGQLLIGADGYPIKNNSQQIIGNPLPDFTLAFINSFSYKKFDFSFKFDMQQGGDLWNGTQQVMNYHGVSQSSAYQRNITNYVFDGQLADGTTNTIPVTFADASQDINENRWVRYGYEGVASEAIQDASYINLTNINLAYSFKNKKTKNILQVNLYANNIWTYTATKGTAPFSTLYGQSGSTSLQYFNMPISKSFGVRLNYQL